MAPRWRAARGWQSAEAHTIADQEPSIRSDVKHRHTSAERSTNLLWCTVRKHDLHDLRTDHKRERPAVWIPRDRCGAFGAAKWPRRQRVERA